MKKNKKKFGGSKKTPYLCTRNQKLGYGVMVTLQILVLPFLVRVRLPQQCKRGEVIPFGVSLFPFLQDNPKKSQFILWFIPFAVILQLAWKGLLFIPQCDRQFPSSLFRYH